MQTQNDRRPGAGCATDFFNRRAEAYRKKFEEADAMVKQIETAFDGFNIPDATARDIARYRHIAKDARIQMLRALANAGRT